MTILKGILLQGSINNLVGDKNRDLALTRTDTQTQTLTHILTQTYKVKAITHKINKKNRTHTNRLNNSQTHIYIHTCTRLQIHLCLIDNEETKQRLSHCAHSGPTQTQTLINR